MYHILTVQWVAIVKSCKKDAMTASIEFYGTLASFKDVILKETQSYCHGLAKISRKET